ncbi:hypothetical protein PG994_008745 [Apiospora phragmitis]|uniref:Uncharacterized protein n=1 Tax=Apiospora phragmitis TaxID=2905665 RepID=A0ABR1UHW3_9PEZI
MSSSRPMQDGASAAADSTSSSTTTSAAAAAAAAPHSHAVRTYVTEPRTAGNRNAALPDSQTRTVAEAVQEDEMRVQRQLNEHMRKLRSGQ